MNSSLKESIAHLQHGVALQSLVSSSLSALMPPLQLLKQSA